MRYSKAYDSLRGLFTGQIYNFNFRQLHTDLLPIQAVFTVCHVFLFAAGVAGLRESQSQVLNSNLLRDKLKLSGNTSKTKICCRK